MKLLFVIPNLDYMGAARQLVLLAMGLPRERFALRVCVLGKSSPWVETLRAAGVEVEVLAWSRIFDLRPWITLLQQVRAFQPEVLHVWNFPRPWMGSVLRRWAGAARLIVSDFPPARDEHSQLHWLDRRWVHSKKYQVVVHGLAEAERCRRLGLTEDCIVQIPLAVALPTTSAESGEVRRTLGLPLQARLIIGTGPLEPHKGFHDAIWALDILKYLYNDLHLVLIGEGTDRPRLVRFANALNVQEQVHFVGRLSDPSPLLYEAEVVWVPSRREGGKNAALEAMAARRPVIASELPGLAEIVRDGKTGVLVPPGSPATLARHTRVLIDNAALRQAMGEAGRRRVETCFSVVEMVERYYQLYLGR